MDETVSLQVDVTNACDRTGDEVVQLYVRDVESSVVRPKLELRGFKRIHLEAGQTATVTFELAAAQLGYQDGDSYVVEPGVFCIQVGPSSGDLQQMATVQVNGDGQAIAVDRVFLSSCALAAH